MEMATLSFLLPILVLFVLIPQSTSNGATQALVNRICRETNDSGYCEDIFNKHIPGGVADVKGLTQIALTQTLLYATDTRIFLQRSQAKETDPNTKNLYEICISGYGLLMNQFENASLAFAKGDYRSLVFEVGKCDRFVTDCQSVLGGTVAPVKDKNSNARVLVKMTLVSGGLI